VLAGATATALYASSKSWAVVIPAQAWMGGIASAILIGAVEGLLPAVRASRMPPTVVLRTASARRDSTHRQFQLQEASLETAIVAGPGAFRFVIAVPRWLICTLTEMTFPFLPVFSTGLAGLVD
jgi:predicted lysophospholipase L1 biosynthesis ABC-type transport system permease subunit